MKALIAPAGEIDLGSGMTGQSPHWTLEQNPEFAELWDRVAPYTMTSPERGLALYNAVNHVIDNSVPGAFVECGVWKGGSSMLIALTLLARGIDDRNLILIDTFDGMTEPGSHDVDRHGQTASGLMGGQKGEELADLVLAKAGLDAVKAAMASTGYPARRIRYAKGDARLDLPNIHTSIIALLRLDTDFYDSTKAELETLYKRVSQGAPVLIDDYGHWAGCKKAVDEFFQNEAELGRHKAPALWSIDYTGRLLFKPEAPLKADIERYDYVPLGFEDPGLLPLFEDAVEINPWTVGWKYLRSASPHKFRADQRNHKGFHIGYASYEEAICLFNLARIFSGKRGLEIGSHFGWTSAHLKAAGLEMDFADIAFAELEREVAVRRVLDAAPGEIPFRIWSDPSPDVIPRIAEGGEPISFAFIDGSHDAPDPANDAKAVLPFMADDAVVVFHDLTSPDVHEGLSVMKNAGWHVVLWNTMQILGVAWRGNVDIPDHVPDPNTARIFHAHLQPYEIAGDIT